MNTITEAKKVNVTYVGRTISHPLPYEKCTLTPYGIKLFRELNGGNNPTLDKELYDALHLIGNALSLHSNAFASYIVPVAIMHEQLFYQWSFYFEQAMGFIWDQSKIPAEYKASGLVFDPYRKLDELAKSNKYIADNQQMINSLFTQILLDGFRGEIHDIFIPDITNWKNVNAFDVLVDTPYIFRKKDVDGYLFINGVDRIQLLSQSPELTNLLWIQLHTKDYTEILCYTKLDKQTTDAKYVYRAWMGGYDPFCEVKN